MAQVVPYCPDREGDATELEGPPAGQPNPVPLHHHHGASPSALIRPRNSGEAKEGPALDALEGLLWVAEVKAAAKGSPLTRRGDPFKGLPELRGPGRDSRRKGPGQNRPASRRLPRPGGERAEPCLVGAGEPQHPGHLGEPFGGLRLGLGEGPREQSLGFRKAWLPRLNRRRSAEELRVLQRVRPVQLRCLQPGSTT